jgi:uncharacterized protein YodC (DUF2158 family)
MAFKMGTTVQLKSGGPVLTVLEVTGDSASCIYFSDEIGTFQRDSFPIAILDEVDFADEPEEDDEG